jgi:hypothetical protein
MYRRVSRLYRRGLIVFALALVASRGSAQTVVNPTTVDFDPSPDQSAFLPDGRPVISQYDLWFYVAGGVQPIQVVTLGKPSPASDGKIHANFTMNGASASTAYQARVAAVGPSGTGLSGFSNTFSYGTGSSCAFALSPNAVPIAALGGPGSVSVTTGATCAWTAASSAPWLVIQTGPSSGSNAVSFSVAQNTTATPRSATVTVGGSVATINQAAAGCTFGVSPTSLSVSANASSSTVTVTSPSGCTWTDSSSTPWITLAATGGTATGPLGYTVAANTSTTARNGSFTVAGTTVAVQQAGAAACTFGVSPTNLSVGASASSGLVTVTTSTGCKWTYSNSTPWITLLAGKEGATSVSYSVAANTGTPRSGSFTVAGKSIAVQQAGVGCTFGLSSTSQTFDKQGGTGSLTVKASSPACGWTLASNATWISIVPPTATDLAAGKVTFKVARNDARADRVGTLTIAGQTFTVTQKR